VIEVTIDFPPPNALMRAMQKANTEDIDAAIENVAREMEAEMKSRGRSKVRGRIVEVSGPAKAVERVVDKLLGNEVRVGQDPRSALDLGAIGKVGSLVAESPQPPQNGAHDPARVEHPRYYGGADDPYEAIKVIEAWGATFNVGSALKYMRRAGVKDPHAFIEDLEKAIWYLRREVQLLRGVRPAEDVRHTVSTLVPTYRELLSERELSVYELAEKLDARDVELVALRAEVHRLRLVRPARRATSKRKSRKGAR
jgi:chromosome condensin MukBEF MukE localization factor